jgi:hypothetical protein
MKLTTHLLLVLRSRIHGAIPPPPYIFMVWYLNTGTTLPLQLGVRTLQIPFDVGLNLENTNQLIIIKILCVQLMELADSYLILILLLECF